jgi:hypothetical protein
MRQPQDPDDYDEDLDRYDDEDEQFGRPVYQGTGLTVRELSAEELQRFLDANVGQPAQLLGSGWAALDPRGHPLEGPRTPPASTAAVPAEVTGSLGSPGRSALVEYRRRRALELAAWTRTLTWRAPLIAAAGLAGQVLAIQTELLHGGLVGLAVAILVGWRQRFRLSEQVTAWRRGAKGERRTARLLDRLTRDGFVVFHDLAIPGSPANVDSPDDRLYWRVRHRQQAVDWNRPPERRWACLAQPPPPRPHPGDGPLGSAGDQPPARHPRRRPAVRPRRPCPRRRPARPRRGDRAGWGLRDALGQDRVLSDADIQLLAAAARLRLRPAA